MIKVGIIGATGYAGGELVRILTGHREAEIKWYGSRSYIDKKYADVYQNMFQIIDAALNEMVVAAIRLDDVEIVLAPAGVNVRVAGVLLLFPFMVGFQRPRRVALVLLKSQNCVLCH